MLPIKTPLGTDSFLEEVGIGAGGDTIDLIVRAHDAGHFSILYTHSEWHIECILYVLLAHLRPSISLS